MNTRTPTINGLGMFDISLIHFIGKSRPDFFWLL